MLVLDIALACAQEPHEEEAEEAGEGGAMRAIDGAHAPSARRLFHVPR
jgi:hypothetical protein